MSSRRSRMERTNSLDTPSSLFRRLQGKKNGSKTASESLSASQPTPHRRMLSRDRKRPTVIYYSSDRTDLDESTMETSTITDGELSEDESPRFKRFPSEDMSCFHADGKKQDLVTSMGPRETVSRCRGHSSTRGPGRAFMRMTQSFSRASERMDLSVDGDKEHRRALRQSAKYDVTWRQDDESACCQVCFAMFTKISRRRHHCRVCGELVCGACSQDQVVLVDKFSSPRRACMACCSLLQAMARAGDDRVKVVEPDMGSATSIRRHHQSAPVASTSQSPSLPTPTATPRYRDRFAEVHRVMAAGKLSRRRGSSEKKMYVISSRWLRRWLAFTSAASHSNSLGYDFDVPDHGETHNMGRAPTPIDNLGLLELARGKLVPRPGLIRDDIISGDAASAGDDADFQLLTPEVWEVFQRLYGGGPAIYVNLTSAEPTTWIIDVSGLLAAGANGSNVPVLPIVERALRTRHKGEQEFAPGKPYSNHCRMDSESTTPVDSQCTLSNYRQPSPAGGMTSSSSSSSLSEFRSPTGHGKMHFDEFESDVAVLPVKVIKNATEGDDAGAPASVRSPKAAVAASAFAVAMKQARLNAQKAIDDRASRVIAA
ncbi:hypothetical protein PsorP6_010219 [Peronosclerospora sorghi]|uniref:Uncharacterized protein n=1 Tax=Peronosclerospora sorghi TaxID=230839 RepID=A0ACC0VU72_9STRA|nr:hypothetical protein PsorP6_010219 [Peronosclerospora sorghi]